MSGEASTRPAREQARAFSKPAAHRVIPVLTLLVAVAWAVATWRVAGHVGTVNFARGLGAAMTGALIDRDALGNAPTPLESLLGLPPSAFEPERPAPRPSEHARALSRQIIFTEAVVYRWQMVMYAVSGGFLLVGAVGCLTRYVRGPHLAAAVVMLLSTAATLTAMELLAAPDKGGLERLSLWTYLMVIALQSVYALVLLLVFARRRPVVQPAKSG